MYDVAFLKKKAKQIRATCIQMAHDGKESHLNGALSCVDILIALYYQWLRIFPNEQKNPQRDRFVFSKGHACSALYAVLADRGLIPKEWLFTYAKTNSHLPSHPCIHMLPLLECSSGSLGHGLGIGTGMAYGLKLKKSSARVVILLSDGECNEGSIWEAAMFAVANKLDNVLAIVDYNKIQSIGRTDLLTGGASWEAKFHAFGWAVKSVNGLEVGEILSTFEEFPFESGKPSVIIAKTRAGAGVSFIEDQVLWHYRTPSDEDLQRAIEELGEIPIHLQQENS